MTHRLRLLAIALFLTAPVHAQTPQARIDEVARHFADLPVTGMTIAVMRDGQLVHNRGYGLAHRENGVRATAGTVYEIGSITKQFTAAAILRLAEQGALTLDDPVAMHFPELAERAGSASLRHLLSHSSGLYSGPVSDDPTRPIEPSTVIAEIARHPSEFDPGARHRYNNNGYLLLGLLIERLGGRPYGDYLSEAFFEPLGLASTGLCTTPRGDAVARGYSHPTRGEAVPTPHPVHHPTVSFSAGAICSTSGDLLAWQHALATGRVVSPASVDAMTSPLVLASGKPGPYGLGLYSDERSGEHHIHHGGAASGFVTQLGYFPSDRLGVVVLTNGMYAPAMVEQIEQAVRDAARGGDFQPIRASALTDAERASVLGTYDLGPMTIDVYVQGTTLRAQPAGQIASRLLHQGGRVFVTEHDPDVRMTFTGPDAWADTLTLSQRGRPLPPARRIPDGARD